MVKTPEEIKKALYQCGRGEFRCSECAYYDESEKRAGCGYVLNSHALAYIEQLERERDAVVAELKGYGCTYCKYLMRQSKHKCGKKCVDFCNWEWCGVKKEKNG